MLFIFNFKGNVLPYPSSTLGPEVIGMLIAEAIQFIRLYSSYFC